MKIKFLGHSCFLITSSIGVKIITDPYHTGEEFNLNKIKESADIITVSHDHPDHNNVADIQGNPHVVIETTNMEGIPFKAIDSYHDEVYGRERGKNRIFVFIVDDIRICHLGDLGHQLNENQLENIGSVDVLFVPVGGGFTINVDGAEKVLKDIGAKVIIPMHYRTAGLPFLGDVEEFLSGKDNVMLSIDSEVELIRDSLPEKPKIIVLKPELLTT
jgi:L-ascorbate metabolism protein UlaG (beta-lactamase superfamily)